MFGIQKVDCTVGRSVLDERGIYGEFGKEYAARPCLRGWEWRGVSRWCFWPMGLPSVARNPLSSRDRGTLVYLVDYNSITDQDKVSPIMPTTPRAGRYFEHMSFIFMV